MAVRILCRVSGGKDVVLTLQPGHWERVDFARADGEYVYPPNVGIFLLEDSTGVVHGRMHIDEQRPAAVEQLALGAAS